MIAVEAITVATKPRIARRGSVTMPWLLCFPPIFGHPPAACVCRSFAAAVEALDHWLAFVRRVQQMQAAIGQRPFQASRPTGAALN